GEPAFRARLDTLLSSALAEQAREQEGFMRVLQSSRDTLAAVRSELDEVRAFVERRDQAIVALLEERLPDADAEENIRALSRRVESLDEEHASLKRSISVKLDSIGGSVEAVEWRIQESPAAPAGRSARSVSSASGTRSCRTFSTSSPATSSLGSATASRRGFVRRTRAAGTAGTPGGTATGPAAEFRRWRAPGSRAPTGERRLRRSTRSRRARSPGPVPGHDEAASRPYNLPIPSPGLFPMTEPDAIPWPLVLAVVVTHNGRR